MRYLLILITLLFSSAALAQECPEGHTCVENSDMEHFLELARQKKCMQEVLPEVEASDLVITVDKDGRVYGSGTGLQPYTLQVNWCQYTIKATSQVRLQVAKKGEPRWGFRFRLKATFGVLVAEAFHADEAQDVLDGGLLLEAFHVRWFNINAYVGVRSVGVGVGVDLTKNMGVYVGYSLLWANWRSSPIVSTSFAF